MPLKMRPTGLGHGVYKDNVDYSVFCGEWCIGRIYTTRTGPESLRWFCALHAAKHPVATPDEAQGRNSRRAGSSGRRGRRWKRSPEPGALISDPCTAYTSHPEP